ncbi:type II toxin-antitoxin system ParD family antitoxin [Chelatococcus sambhunathii]|uniref:Type II toxin-antitoxin system ParD family antitoxin n=1 Tax=Chelatococcus sambhunathii TaxID=363953 RepID=A0ABU1DIX7_9HYPH|nr:type II toxin-antitoxin system ParD family antitoxin [Chelatococcus sambhunathii]MDR4308085.1 type II toxin-antitoxin system ParD family antitoxin [Chelatococcus sambhunathii]
MATRNVQIASDLAVLIDSAVDSGEYASAEEVVREAVLEFGRQRMSDEQKLAALRAAIDEGIADVEAGRIYEGTVEDILQDVLRRARG